MAPARAANDGDAPVYKIGGIPDWSHKGIPGRDSCPFAANTGAIDDLSFNGSPALTLFNQVDKAFVDSDGCPFATPNGKPIVTVGSTGATTKAYFIGCERFYRHYYRAFGPKPADRPDSKAAVTKISCCYIPQGGQTHTMEGHDGQVTAREDCILSHVSMLVDQKTRTGHDLVNIGFPRPGYNSVDEVQAAQAQAQAEKDAKKQCTDDALNQIEQYWASKAASDCIAHATTVITNIALDLARGNVDQALGLTTVASTGTMIYGGFTAVVSAPAAWSLANIAATLAKLAVEVGVVAKQISDLLNNLLGACGKIIPGIQNLENWEKALTSGQCSPLQSLIVRQLTQCIRIDSFAGGGTGSVGVDLSLPSVQFAMQCPINITVTAHAGSSGFNCFSTSAAAQSPLTASDSSSIISDNGGIERLFDSSCFSGASSPDSGVNPQAPSIGGSRIPGADCGQLSTDALHQQTLKGTRVLQQARASNGWAVGGSETIVSGNQTIQITRCDDYNLGQLVRTDYVYGDGSSCGGSFLDGSGYETNTACYNNSYTPFTSNVPDACQYPTACLDASGNFSAALKGQTGCPSNVQPTFCGGATPCPVCTLADMSQCPQMTVYPTMTSGGVNGGVKQYRSCAEFDPNSINNAAPICCDPSKQDCRPTSAGGPRDANTPLCTCNQGDANNTVKTDTAGNPDPNGTCVNGGNLTCCSPRLNGGNDGCTALGYGPSAICSDEKSQCVSEPGTYTGPDGSQQPISVTQVALSKPSPFIYLFIRPDAQFAGQSCCTTEWCNICPQEYANAYGLSLVLATPGNNPAYSADSTQTSYDSINRAILGKGWPYTQTTDPGTGAVSYTIAPTPFVYKAWSLLGANTMTVTINGAAPLYLSSQMQVKPSAAQITACNSISPWHIAGYADQSAFSNNSVMGLLGPGTDKADPIIRAGVPDMSETPLAYLNRLISSTASNNGSQPTQIQLCSDIAKMCTNTGAAPTSTPVTGGGTSGGGSITTPGFPSSGGGGGGGGNSGGGSITTPQMAEPQSATPATTSGSSTPGLF